MEAFFEDKSWEALGAVADFKKHYGGRDGLLKYVILADSKEYNPDTAAALLVRVFLQKESRSKKYILGLRFYSYGDLATLDIVALDHPQHKDILAEHSQKLGWINFGSENDAFSPFIVAGGFVNAELEFYGHSLDYGQDIFAWQANEIAAAALRIIDEEPNATHPAFSFILDFMMKYKNSHDFYEKLYKEASATAVLKPHQLSALVSMKVLDRAFINGDNYLDALVEESTTGLGREIFFANLAKVYQKK